MNWIIVHKQDSYELNNRVIGFESNIHNVKNIREGDQIVYYHTGKLIRGLYEVVEICEAPMQFEKSWNTSYQFRLSPILELKKCISFDSYVPYMNFIGNKDSWGPSLMGVNAIRELVINDFVLLEEAIYNAYNYENHQANSGGSDEKSIQELMNLSKKELEERIESSNQSPSYEYSVVKKFRRNPDVVAYSLKRANGICEICKTPAPFIRRKDNTPYLEVHHKTSISEGGLDNIENTIAVCPNCHTELHYGIISN